ncbi:MAG: UDP-N-acetylmuramate dehydrogenase [Burkholderiales bacterium]|nr:UDP-N-acetylmuramate dehydrogenase [Burkholderiales bacterium]
MPGEKSLRAEIDDQLLWAELVRRPLRGVLREREPMSRHTSWRAGGIADRTYHPADLADLAIFLRSLPDTEPVHFVGLGSNLLVRDGGLRGTVILLHGGLKQMRMIARNDAGEACIYAEAGVASPKLSRFAATHNFEGAEFLAGIPGTVGGALAMNAGCYGSETWRHVDRVLTIDRKGELRQRDVSEYRVGYREVVLRTVETDVTDEGATAGPGLIAANAEDIQRSAVPRLSDEWFVAAWFKFASSDGEVARRKVKHLLLTRIATQPLSEPNAGSVFRNPPGSYAAQLIEDCGLKGSRFGGAMVSPKHANFIVNTGTARASDIERLIEELRDSVLREFGILLKPEVCIIGEKNHAA